MPQAFYIDADEEVNSVISRLRQSTEKRIVLVVARRALILQSSVSLRLIKSEMDALDKKVLIVTQDERGLSLAKKIGFSVRTSTEGLDLGDGNNAVNGGGEKDLPAVSSNDVHSPQRTAEEELIKKKNRLNNLGSDKFVSVSGVIKKPSLNKNTKRKIVKPVFFGKEMEDSLEAKNTPTTSGSVDLRLDQEKENEFKDLFVEANNDTTKKDKIAETNKSKRKSAKNFLILFLLVASLLLAGVLGYLFLPKADVQVYVKKFQESAKLNVKAIANQGNGENNVPRADDNDNLTIPAKLINEEDTLSLTFQATGEKALSSKKARGRITIYNNYSESSQILVATTRFLTEDGKLYRLTKTVTVPGMTVDEQGNKKAGEIQAEVVADSAGEEYNIGPSKFTIPGFKGGPKYDKFYAQSFQPMHGGGEGNDRLKTITKEDIVKAKQETIKKAKEQLLEKMKKEIGEGSVIPDDAVKFEILDTAGFPEEGAVSDNFEYQVKLKGEAIYFKQDDLNKEIDQYLKNKILSQEKTSYPVEVVSVDKKIENPEVDFDSKTLTFSLSLNITIKAKVDADKLKSELLSKNQQQINQLMNKYPEIQKLEATITPTVLAGKMPRYAKRIFIEIKE